MPESANIPAEAERPVALEEDENFVSDLEALVATGDQGTVLNLALDLNPADLARLLPHLRFENAVQLFRWLPNELAGDVLPDLDDDYRASLLEEETSGRLTEMLDEMEVDDAVDLLADLPQDVVRDVLPTLEDADEVEELLAYPEDTAGGLMSSELVAVHDQGSVADATEEVRHTSAEVENVYAAYVVDAEGKLVGVVGLTQLLLTQAAVPLARIMDPDVVSVGANLDQEEVARIMERYDLVVLPVVDDSGKLLGRITIDDVVDVIREEAEEDIQKMSGIVRDEELTASVFKISRGRLVWLLVGLLGASLSAVVIYAFEDVLDELVILTMFIPVVMAMAGNAGIQSSAIAVQGLASGELWARDIPKQLAKEVAVAVINGLAVGVVFGLIVFLMQQASLISLETSEVGYLAAGVAVALLAVMILAATIGAAVPIFLERVGIDPALATGPFITTTNDIIGLIVYFLIASWIVLPNVG